MNLYGHEMTDEVLTEIFKEGLEAYKEVLALNKRYGSKDLVYELTIKIKDMTLCDADVYWEACEDRFTASLESLPCAQVPPELAKRRFKDMYPNIPKRKQDENT